MSAPVKTDAERLEEALHAIRQKNKELASVKKQLAKAQEESDTAANIREFIYGIARHDPNPPQWTLRGGITGHRGTPCTVWSDLHYGEVVRKNQTGGKNEYNKQVAAKRMKKLTETTIDLAFNHMGRAKTTYPGVVICLGGDIIGGDIHDELLRSNDRTVQLAIEETIDLLAAGIDNMATRFGNAFVPCVVGNHGRSTHRLPMKNRVHTSHEYNVYCGLNRHFRKSKHIQFLIPEDADANFRVYNHRYLLTHGDSLGVKGGDGIIGAIGPIMRGTMKVHRSEAQIGKDFDTLIMGHWHQYITLPGLICNNAFKGYDEYARLGLRAPFSRASQALWFTHPEHGITAHWQVYLQGQQAASQSSWCSWDNTGNAAALPGAA